MSRYLVDQLATRANIRVLFRTEVAAAHGETSLEAIDVRDAATGETTRLESGGLFIFIGADAETGWLPPEIALDPKGYVLTGSDVARRRTLGARPRPVPARDERSRHLRLRRRPLQPREARRGSGRRGQHGDRLRAPVPERRRSPLRPRVSPPSSGCGRPTTTRTVLCLLVALELAERDGPSVLDAPDVDLRGRPGLAVALGGHGREGDDPLPVGEDLVGLDPERPPDSSMALVKKPTTSWCPR